MRELLIVSCSSLKWDAPGEVPAVMRYNGPAYRLLRSFFRERGWPHPVKLAVLSAEYGLIGGLASIPMYDRRMTPERARELEGRIAATLKAWSAVCSSLIAVCGKDYLDPLLARLHETRFADVRIAPGPIGMKLQYLSHYLRQASPNARPSPPELAASGRPMYFLPDWDDMLDKDYDFEADRFSAPAKQERREVHAAALMGQKVCDGILLSLAQQFRSKGVLKGFPRTDVRSLAPEPIRARFGLLHDQLLFGDCGAFSYVNNFEPPITVEQAASVYDLHEFDLGASVDHIPAPFLSPDERDRRVELTRKNAEAFLKLHRHLRCRFIPVGVIQGTSPESYASQVLEYAEMGYRHIGIGGLVFRSDAEIEEIVNRISEARKKVGRPLWIHLFGIFRPRLQPLFRELGVSSFDSASYFRKAWLRSGQNYLGADGNWYAAVRVPVSSDPRNKKKLREKGISLDLAQKLERDALRALHLYGRGQLGLEETLQAVLAYDDLVDRNEKHITNLALAYRRTLQARPWERCGCQVCAALGIDVVVFRGANRNKRRGIHNTWMLYRQIIGMPRTVRGGEEVD